MSKSNTFENDFLLLIFNAIAIANIADNAAGSPLTNLFVALHTGAGPLDAGNQETLEADYTSYAREAVLRTSGGWTVSGNSVSPVATISFTTATGGTNTITFASVGTLVSGTGKVLWYGTVTPNIVVTSGVTPQLTTDSTIDED